MWALIKALLARWAIFKLLLKSFGSLAWLIPLAFLLKAIGWPVLIVMLVLAIPLFIVLAVIGLPLLAVIAGGGIMLMIVFWVLATGLMLLKIAIPALLVFWIVRWFWKRNGGRGRGRGGRGSPKNGGDDGPDGSDVGARVPEPPTAGMAGEVHNES